MQMTDSNAFIQGNALADSSVAAMRRAAFTGALLQSMTSPVVIPVIRRIERLKGSKYEMIQRG